MCGNNHFGCDGYCVDHANVQSDYGLYGCSESASGDFNEQYYRDLVTGFQQCSDGHLHLYAQRGTMCGNHHFGCDGYCFDHANIQPDCGLYGCSQSASGHFNEQYYRNLVSGVQ